MKTFGFSDSEQVAKEVLNGEGMSFSQLAKLVPPYRQNKPTSKVTVWRWVIDGVNAPDGTRVYLEASRVGCRYVTSRAALSRFISKLGNSSASAKQAMESMQEIKHG